MRMPFGKHVGEELQDIPVDYIRWVLRNIYLRNPDLRAEAEFIGGERASAKPGGDRWESRGHARSSPPPPREANTDALYTALVDALNRWRRKQAAQHHPDRGGDTRVMQAINTAGDDLMAVVTAMLSQTPAGAY